jgi:hypothetical protein
MMDGTISGYLINAVAREIITPSQLSLTRVGVLGESLTQADEHGRFAFPSLPAGEYSLGVYDNRYAPLYRKLSLQEGESIENLEMTLTPGAFLKGRLINGDGQPPMRSHVTLIREGTRRGKSGYIKDSGDHRIAQDGSFSSPPLHPCRYFLRFAGILQKQSASTSSQLPHADMQQRIFDFLYPNALDIKDADYFDLQIGQTLSDLEIRIPRPIWHTVRGKIIGTLPENPENVYVMFTRDIGMLDDLGGGGPHLKADGTFEGHAQPGRYRLLVWEMSPPQPDGRSTKVKEFTSLEITVGDRDLEGVEIQI